MVGSSCDSYTVFACCSNDKHCLEVDGESRLIANSIVVSIDGVVECMAWHGTISSLLMSL